MAKPPKPGKCVHCLSDPVPRNWDHVFPASWYPDTTTPNLKKWQVPSCINCNRALGAVESEFFVRVALSLDPNNPASRSLVEKALRAVNPKLARDAVDRRARIALKDRLFSDMYVEGAIPENGIFPNLGERWNRAPDADLAAIRIPVHSFRRITEKIVRGITYLDQDKFIEPPYAVEFFALDDNGALPVREYITQHGTTLAHEPGIVVRHAVTPDDEVSALFEVEFWQQFKTYAIVHVP